MDCSCGQYFGYCGIRLGTTVMDQVVKYEILCKCELASLNLLILTKSGWPLGLRMAILHFTDPLMRFNNNMIICEEAWEKGPIASKYCFEKNTLKVSQIFRRIGKRDL